MVRRHVEAGADGVRGDAGRGERDHRFGRVAVGDGDQAPARQAARGRAPDGRPHPLYRRGRVRFAAGGPGPRAAGRAAAGAASRSVRPAADRAGPRGGAGGGDAGCGV